MVSLRAIMRLALVLSAITLLHAQGTPPKSKATDYPLHVQLESVTLAAEYLVHTLPTRSGSLIANDYLVVEVAFYGPPFGRLNMSPDNFSLRINNSKETITPELAGMVAASIKYSMTRPHVEASGSVGVGDGTVSVGPRAPPSRFPGDGNERTAGSQPTVKSVNEESSIDNRVQGSMLPQGEQTLPRSGLLYFPFRGKTKNIRSLDLFYDGPMGRTILKLVH